MSSNISMTTIDPIVASMLNARTGIQRIGQPILLTFGIIGCILNIAIFLRPSMRSNSCAIYFHASSWANLFCLTWGLLISMLLVFIKDNPLPYNAAYCKIRFYILTASQLSSRACVVLACLDRFLLCSQSVRQRSFCRPSVAIRITLLTILFCACISIYALVVYDIFPAKRQCTTSSATGRILDTIVLFVFNFGIPAILMSALTGTLIWRLRKNFKRMENQRIQVRNRDVQLATMLIGQVVLYIVTALPFVINMAYTTATQYVPSSSKSRYRHAAEYLSITATGAFGTYLFNGLSFYIYTLTAPIFRRELIAVFTPRRWKLNSQQIEQHQVTNTNRINPSFQANK